MFKNFGFSGIWNHPQSTIAGLVGGVGMIAVALGADPVVVAKVATGATGALVSIIGMFYKGTPQAPPGN